jgi:SnoaL-like protein
VSDAIDPLERLLAERACERLVYRYAHLLDLGEADRVPGLFADDGVWELPGRIRFEGRAELDAGIPSRLNKAGRTARHVCTNVVIDVLSPTEAVGTSYMINYRHDDPSGVPAELPPAGEPLYMGEYRDRFVRTEDGWRFLHRRTELAFAGPPAAG